MAVLSAFTIRDDGCGRPELFNHPRTASPRGQVRAAPPIHIAVGGIHDPSACAIPGHDGRSRSLCRQGSPRPLGARPLGCAPRAACVRILDRAGGYVTSAGRRMAYCVELKYRVLAKDASCRAGLTPVPAADGACHRARHFRARKCRLGTARPGSKSYSLAVSLHGRDSPVSTNTKAVLHRQAAARHPHPVDAGRQRIRGAESREAGAAHPGKLADRHLNGMSTTQPMFCQGAFLRRPVPATDAIVPQTGTNIFLIRPLDSAFRKRNG